MLWLIWDVGPEPFSEEGRMKSLQTNPTAVLFFLIILNYFFAAHKI
jgi:hypothetical protein